MSLPEPIGFAVPVIKNGAATNYPLVKGRCPACGSSSLFVGAGGYVTCSWLECSEPDAASRALGA